MLNSEEKKNSNSRGVRKKNSEWNKKPYPPLQVKWSVAKHASIFYFGMCLYGKNTLIIKLGTDHLTCRGVWFFVSFRIFFSDNTRVRILFFCCAKVRLYDKNSELDYFILPPPKSEYFFQQHWVSVYIFLEKKP
jgi:hypothetical protein